MDAVPTKVSVQGKVAYRDRGAERVNTSISPTAAWPMAPCVGSGVNASQAQELRDFYKKHGLNVRVTNDGDPIYDDPKQRKRALKVRGLHDNNSYD